MSQGCQEKNSRKMHFFRKQEPTNFAYFSAKNEKRYLTTVCVIIIMKKLHRGVAQMVARMVRDHEAASSSLATPTIIGPNIDTMCRCLVRFFLPGKPLTARLSAVSGCICTGVRHNQASFRRYFPETSTLAGKANVSNGHKRFNKESP